jgi:hypothetical protein
MKSADPDRLAAEIALNAFTPVDHSIYGSLLPAARERHVGDLVKRLSIAAELSCGGGSARLARTLAEPAGPGAEDPDGLIGRLDALVEFGRLPAELSGTDLEQAGRSQIRDEILHFDRIMDLESLGDGRDLKRRRENVWDTGPLAAAERLLTLTYERRILRGDEQPEWLSAASAQPGRVTAIEGVGAVLVRESAPQLVAVAAGPGASGCLARLQAYCGKHPLGVAIGLLDYEMHMNGEQPCTLAAAAAADWFGARRVKVWACGDAAAFKARRDGYDQEAGELTVLAGDPAGSRSTAYGRAVFEIGPAERLVLALGRPGHRREELSRLLSQPNKSGRILLHDNAVRALGTGLVAVFKPQPAAAPPQEAEQAVGEYLTSRVASWPGAVRLSVEVGHVHADRELGPIQERGIDLGVELAGQVARLNAERGEARQVDLEIVPMIDDDHVVNRLSYARYQRVLAGKGVPAAEIVLESSPSILDIACDLLKVAVRRDGQGYTLQRRGANLYLESGILRIELVEDVEDGMRIGCVVYDTALTLYRAARPVMRAVFADRSGYDGDLHQDMLVSYDKLDHPADRADYRCRMDKLWKRPFAAIAAEPGTPYLDAYAALQRDRAGRGETAIVLNILEDYYEPLELKVRQLAALLGVEISLECLLFSPYGAGLRTLHA